MYATAKDELGKTYHSLTVTERAQDDRVDELVDMENVLMGGGTDMDAYDYRELAGAEVLPPSKDQGLLREALAWIENSEQKAPSLCGDIRKALGLPDND